MLCIITDNRTGARQVSAFIREQFKYCYGEKTPKWGCLQSHFKFEKENLFNAEVTFGFTSAGNKCESKYFKQESERFTSERKPNLMFDNQIFTNSNENTRFFQENSTKRITSSGHSKNAD
ncbi:MAG: hypothetical protein Kow0068_04020 [Marinilabiliales bacterium]